jgi:hypothetical protein
MKSSTTESIKKYINGIIKNINERDIPFFVLDENGKKKRLSPKQIDVEKKIKVAQIEVLNVIKDYVVHLENTT